MLYKNPFLLCYTALTLFAIHLLSIPRCPSWAMGGVILGPLSTHLTVVLMEETAVTRASRSLIV